MNPNITYLVEIRYGTAAINETTQQMDITKIALVRSENGRMDRFIGLQITRYLSREKDNMVSTLAYEALIWHHRDSNRQLLIHLSEMNDLSLQKASENGYGYWCQ